MVKGKKLKHLLGREQIVRNRIERLIQSSQRTVNENRTKGFYEARQCELKRLWSEYESLDQSITDALCNGPSDTMNNYLTEDNYGTLEAKYSNFMGEIFDNLRQNVEISDSTHIFHTNNSDTNNEQTVLPKIALPKYNGDYDGWRSFHDLFVALVHSNTRLKPVQKLYYLKTSLVGDAERLLRHTPITNEDYIPAYNKLKERYENTKILTNHQLKILTNQPKISSETATGLKSLLDTTEECLQQLKSLQIDTSSWDIIIVYLLVQKLPFNTLKLWEEQQGTSQALPTYTQFKLFLQTRLKVLEAISDTLGTKPSQTKVSPRHPTSTIAYHAIRSAKCSLCQDEHPLWECNKYLAMDIKSKHRFIASKGRCYNCLSTGHSTKGCPSTYRCRHCKERHHTTLHDDARSSSCSSSVETQARRPLQQTTPNNSTNDPQSSKAAITQTYMSRGRTPVLLSTALVTVYGSQNRSQVLRCLIDSGSESSFITHQACKKLKAICYPTSITVAGLNTANTSHSNKKTRLKLHSCGADKTIVEEEFLVIPKITEYLPSCALPQETCDKFLRLELADPTYWRPGKVDVLLGAKVYAQIIREGIMQGTDTTPTAIKTTLGWILLGPVGNSNHWNSKSFLTRTNALDKQIQKFWEIEELPINSIQHEEEVEAENHFQTSHKRLQSGKYEVQLPFVHNTVPALGSSRHQAMKRFENLEKQFSRNSMFKEQYENCLNEYIQLDHMEKTSPPEGNEPHYYIPHHAVFKESTTTKLRVVFDASAKTSNGKSLNQFLMKGPTIQPTLFMTLLNWRKFRIVMNADIEKMYRMIQMHPDHRTFQRIIWRDPKTKKVQDYQLKTVTFGTTSAPFLAIRTLQQLAKDEAHNWPLAAKAACDSFYVDDLLTGADDLAQARELRDQLLNMMNSAGFNLRKWTSNEFRLLEDLPSDHIEVGNTRTFSERDSIKTLGIKWYPKTDNFSFTFKAFPQASTYTKRFILSGIASLYDPLGWLAPIIIEAKLLMQTLWITGLDWDTPVSKTIELQWKNYVQSLQQLEQLKIPRWIHYHSGASVQLHGFCDASLKAYAAAVYIRLQQGENIYTHLLTSKTRVAPIKPVTIPRLELNGAVILVRLLKTIIKGMQLQDAEVIAWTDSTIVLQWIKEHPSKWKIYVANRVVEIQDSLKFEHWKYIPSKDNPADLASRGITVSQLFNQELWWHGPQWLSQSSNNWPNYNIKETTLLEQKTTKIN